MKNIIKLVVKSDDNGSPVMGYQLLEAIVGKLYACKQLQPALTVRYVAPRDGESYFLIPLALQSNHAEGQGLNWNQIFFNYNFDFGAELQKFFAISTSIEE